MAWGFTSGLNYVEPQRPQAFILAVLSHASVVAGSPYASCMSRLRACVLCLRVLSLSVPRGLRVPCFHVYMSFPCLSRISLCIPALLMALLRYNLHTMQIT